MAKNPEVRSEAADFYKKFNQGVLVAEIGVAAIFPPLAVPAIMLAAGNVIEIAVIDKFNKKKPAQTVVYQRDEYKKAA